MKANRRSAARLAAVAMGAGLLVGLAHPPLWAGGTRPAPPALVIHVVAPGETLWSLALRYAPEQDPRHYIYDLQRLNHLGTAPLLPGENLTLP